MDKVKKEKKDLTERYDDSNITDGCVLDGKKLHDLYRHTTKLIE